MSAAHHALPYMPPRAELFCPRCQARINDWTSLELVGYQPDPEGDLLELRNCQCRNTMSVLLEGEAKLAALWPALEATLRQGESIGRELRVRVVAGRTTIMLENVHGTQRVIRGPDSLAWGVLALLGHLP